MALQFRFYTNGTNDPSVIADRMQKIVDILRDASDCNAGLNNGFTRGVEFGEATMEIGPEYYDSKEEAEQTLNLKLDWTETPEYHTGITFGTEHARVKN